MKLRTSEMHNKARLAKAAYRREWEAKRVLDGVGIAELSTVQQEYRTKAATAAHLQDIHRHHGFGKTWETLEIPAERPRFLFASRVEGSCCGSPAAMCAGG